MLRFDILEEIFWLLPDKDFIYQNSLKQHETHFIAKIIEDNKIEEYRFIN